MTKQSRGMCRLCGYSGTKASMTKHLAACPGRASGDGATRELFRLRVSGGGPYWLDLETAETATLDDLDAFLRGIWLECCGHLSEFTIGPQGDWDSFDPFEPPKKSNQPPLHKLLTVGQKFGYTYDMGSSTELELSVQARETVTAGTELVRLLARNFPPVYPCSKCESPARWIHSWEYDEDTGIPLMYCARHGKTTRDEQLPLVNSPRTGVCGYDGGNLDDWPPAEASAKS